MNLIPILGGAVVLLIAASVAPAAERALDDQGRAPTSAPAPKQAEMVASNQPIPVGPSSHGIHELLCRAGWL